MKLTPEQIYDLGVDDFVDLNECPECVWDKPSGEWEVTLCASHEFVGEEA